MSMTQCRYCTDEHVCHVEPKPEEFGFGVDQYTHTLRVEYPHSYNQGFTLRFLTREELDEAVREYLTRAAGATGEDYISLSVGTARKIR